MKKQRRTSKAEQARQISRIFGMKAHVTYNERVQIAESAYSFLDEMKLNPTLENFINLVDVMNIFVTVICTTDSKKKRQKAYNCQDALQWLWERGYENISHTINDCQDHLISVCERAGRTGSWALDAETFNLMETCIKWYQEVCSVMPRAVLYHCIEQCKGVHKKQQGGENLGYFFLEEAYAKKEKDWESRSITIEGD